MAARARGDGARVHRGRAPQLGAGRDHPGGEAPTGQHVCTRLGAGDVPAGLFAHGLSGGGRAGGDLRRAGSRRDAAGSLSGALGGGVAGGPGGSSDGQRLRLRRRVRFFFADLGTGLRIGGHGIARFGNGLAGGPQRLCAVENGRAAGHLRGGVDVLLLGTAATGRTGAGADLPRAVAGAGPAGVAASGPAGGRARVDLPPAGERRVVAGHPGDSGGNRDGRGQPGALAGVGIPGARPGAEIVGLGARIMDHAGFAQIPAGGGVCGAVGMVGVHARNPPAGALAALVGEAGPLGEVPGRAADSGTRLGRVEHGAFRLVPLSGCLTLARAKHHHLSGRHGSELESIQGDDLEQSDHHQHRDGSGHHLGDAGTDLGPPRMAAGGPDRVVWNGVGLERGHRGTAGQPGASRHGPAARPVRRVSGDPQTVGLAAADRLGLSGLATGQTRPVLQVDGIFPVRSPRCLGLE